MTIHYGPAPWTHQAKVWDISKDLPYFGLWMEPRTGKSKVIIDTATHLFLLGKIRTAIIWAPNGVHRNWITDEIPLHANPICNVKGMIWRTGRVHTKKFQQEFKSLCLHTGLVYFALNIDAASNRDTLPFLLELRKRGSWIMVVDESADIAHMTADRTKAIIKWRDASAYRRCLDGTPNIESPLELYSQCDFLSRGVLGYTNEVAFKCRYAKVKKRPLAGSTFHDCSRCQGRRGNKDCTECEGWGKVPDKTFNQIVGFQNLDEITRKLRKFSVTIKRADLGKMPPVFSNRYYALTGEQKRVYKELSKDYVSELSDGRRVTADMVLTRYLRLQQVLSNFWPANDEIEDCHVCKGEGCSFCGEIGVVLKERPLTLIEKHNPRVDILVSELKRIPGQCTIWCRFHEDADFIMQALFDQFGDCAARYDGRVKEAQRAINKVMYQKGECKYLVGNPAAGGRGLNFSNADYMIFYNNSFRARHRLQAQDRGETMDKMESTKGLDLVAEGTVDLNILRSLKKKRNLADTVMGEGGWLNALQYVDADAA